MGEITLENYETKIKELWEAMKSRSYATKFQPAYESTRASALEILDRNIELCRVVISTQSGASSPDQMEDETPLERVGAELMNDLRRIGINSIDADAIDPAIRTYAELRLSRLRNMRDILKGDLEALTIPDWIEQANTTAPHLEPDLLTRKISTGPTLSDAWDRYRTEKITSRRWKPDDKSTRGYNAQFRDFLEIHGEDSPIASFTREQAQRVIDSLFEFPKHRTKRFGKMSLTEIPEDVETLSASLVSQRIGALSRFFGWALNLDLVSKNPFSGLSVQAEKKSYATYTEADIKELFNLPTNRIGKAWQFWIPRVALYTGARQNEIAQLLITDIKQDLETKTHYFHIIDDDERKRLKTIAARRKVPIHSTLVKNGFFEYIELVKSINGTSLWPGLKAKRGSLGQRVSEYWGDLKNKHYLLTLEFDEKGGAKVFHSLRRYVINQFKHKTDVPLGTIQELVGHEQSGLGETSTYLDESPIKTLHEAIEKLTVPEGLVSWEHPKKFDL